MRTREVRRKGDDKTRDQHNDGEPQEKHPRSIRLRQDEMNRLVSTAKMPDTAIACPAWPSVRCRSEAIGVSRLTGMNSDATGSDAERQREDGAPARSARGCGLTSVPLGLDRGR